MSNFRLLLGARDSETPPVPNYEVLWEYDPTSDSNLVLDGTNIDSMLDVENGSYPAVNTSANTTRWTRATGGSGINNINVAASDSDGLDVFTIQNARSLFSGATGIGHDGVVRFNDLATEDILLARYLLPGASASPWMTFSVKKDTGKFSIATRRIFGDSARTFTSNIAFVEGIQSFFHMWFDPTTCTIRFSIDGVEDVVNLPVTWASGVGSLQEGVAFADPTLGRNASSQCPSTDIGNWRVWLGTQSISERQARRAAMQAIFDTPLLKRTFSTPSRLVADRRYQMDGSEQRDGIVVTGGFTNGGSGNSTVRLVSYLDNSVDSGVTPVTAAQVGSTWSATFNNVPAGDWVAASKEAGEDARHEAFDTNLIGVGDNGLLAGQSPGRKQFGADGRISYGSTGGVGSDTDPVLLPLVNFTETTVHRRFTEEGWFVPAATIEDTSQVPIALATGETIAEGTPINPPGKVGGNGLCVLSKRHYDRYSRGLGMYCRAIGGTPVSDWLLPSGPNWLKMQSALEQTDGPGWDFSFGSYFGGEEEANGGVVNPAGGSNLQDTAATTQLIANYTTFRDQLRTATGDATLPVFINILVRSSTAASDASADAVIDAQLHMIDSVSGFLLAANYRHLDNEDGQHIYRKGYGEWVAPQWEACIAIWKGDETDGEGPQITSATATATENKITLHVTHPGTGTTLEGRPGGSVAGPNIGPSYAGGDEAATGISGFGTQVWVNDLARNITAAYLDTGDIVIEFDGDPLVALDTVDVRYLRGKQPDITMLVYDNLGWPLQPTRSDTVGNGGKARFTAA